MVAGSGGTAPAAIVALAELGVTEITVVARNPDKAAGLVELAVGSARRPGSATSMVARSATPSLPPRWWSARCPPRSRRSYADDFAAAPVLLDAIYNPWPTPLAAAVSAAGGRVIGGLQMLLHQAFAQVEQFTGLPAPRAAMEAALD